MCYAYTNVSSGGQEGLVLRRRWLLLQTPPPPMVITTVRHAPRMGGAREAGGGGSIKQCVCSPSRHPGSFKCRHHHAEYVWSGRLVNKK
ncbi:hypothetical protein SLE2022_160890 [Rubroshorea leprosula]